MTNTFLYLKQKNKFKLKSTKPTPLPKPQRTFAGNFCTSRRHFCRTHLHLKAPTHPKYAAYAQIYAAAIRNRNNQCNWIRVDEVFGVQGSHFLYMTNPYTFFGFQIRCCFFYEVFWDPQSLRYVPIWWISPCISPHGIYHLRWVLPVYFWVSPTSL